MNEEQAVATFLYSTLAGNAAVAALVGDGIHECLAPQGTKPPYIIFNLQAALPDTHTSGTDRRVTVKPLFLVKAVVQGDDFIPADTLYAALDAAISGAQTTVTVGAQDFRIMGCSREQPIRFVETNEGRRIIHVGGMYRILCHRLD